MRAEKLLRDVLEQQRQAFGSEDPDTLSSLNNLQGLYYLSKRYADALPVATEVFERRRRSLASDHPDLFTAQHNLAAILFQLRREEEAEALVGGALEGRRRVIGRRHSGTLRTWELYADILAARGREADATKEYQAILDEIGGDDEPPYPAIRVEISERLRNRGTTGRR